MEKPSPHKIWLLTPPEEGGFAFFFYAMALHQGDPLCDLSINDWLDAMAQGLFIRLKTMVVA